MPTMNEEIIESLRSRSYYADELANKFHLSIHTVREYLDRMYKTEVLHKFGDPKKRSGSAGRSKVLYEIHPSFRRVAPLLKITANAGLTFKYLPELLKFYGKQTNAHKAVSNLPIIVANLLAVGHRYNQMYANGTLDENALAKLRKEIRPLRLEFQKDYEALLKVIYLFKQLKGNEVFWEPAQLATYFNSQMDIKGLPIPPFDITDALNILESER
jgi:predicted transcriptional regulator